MIVLYRIMVFVTDQDLSFLLEFKADIVVVRGGQSDGQCGATRRHDAISRLSCKYIFI